MELIVLYFSVQYHEKKKLIVLYFSIQYHEKTGVDYFLFFRSVT